MNMRGTGLQSHVLRYIDPGKAYQSVSFRARDISVYTHILVWSITFSQWLRLYHVHGKLLLVNHHDERLWSISFVNNYGPMVHGSILFSIVLMILVTTWGCSFTIFLWAIFHHSFPWAPYPNFVDVISSHDYTNRQPQHGDWTSSIVERLNRTNYKWRLLP